MKNDLEDYFIPTKRNKYAPHGLQKAALFGMGMLVVLSFTIANVHSLIWVSSQWMVSTILPAVIVDMTNSEREDQSLGDLRRNSLLDEAAQMKAEQMESPTHRANIMNGNYTEIGVGTAEGTYEGYPTVFVVQLFGTPAAPQPLAAAPEPVEPVVQEETEQEEAVLSESVSLSEDVVVYEAEPVATAVEEEDISETSSGETETTPVSAPQNDVVIADMETTEAGVTLYSDFISTSTGGVPATIEADPTQKSDQVPFYLELATQPHAVLQIFYSIIGILVLLSLLVSIFIEIRHQHPVQIAYGSGLLAVMGVLYYVHMVISNGALIV